MPKPDQDTAETGRKKTPAKDKERQALVAEHKRQLAATKISLERELREEKASRNRAELRVRELLTAAETVDAIHRSNLSRIIAVEEQLMAYSDELQRAYRVIDTPRLLLKRFVAQTFRRVAEILRLRKKLIRRLPVVGPKADGLIIRKSGLFDYNFYLSQALPEHEDASEDPVGHYLSVGSKKGFKPNRYFDPAWYLSEYPDLSEIEVDPLVHYILDGDREGRKTSQYFDTAYYVEHNRPIIPVGMSPLQHFILYGAAEGRPGAPARQNFDGATFFPLQGSHRLGKFESKDELVSILPRGRRLDGYKFAAKVDVIVPVYGGLEETRTCLESVLRYKADNKSFGKLYIIDDCGPDPKLRELLPKIAERDEDIELLINPENLGFVKSVNRGMEASERDIVLLNADTEVHGDWLDRMAMQAMRGGKVASVTAFSNNATICTFPAIGGDPDIVDGRSIAEMDRAFAGANERRAVPMPTGVGFCMYMSRASIEELGVFDEEYGKGYGEENDFCQKAIYAGWTNLLAGDVFVFHHGSVSFGETAAHEQMTGGALLRERFPRYDQDVADWIREDPATPLRFAAAVNLYASDARPKILHVTHAWGGGTEKQIADIIESHKGEALHMLLTVQSVGETLKVALFFPEEGKWRRHEIEVGTFADLAPVLAALKLSRMHVHHAIAVMDDLVETAEGLGLKYDLSIHDYALICPRNNLISTDGTYCGEPDERGCIECLNTEPPGQSRDIIWWRHRGLNVVKSADRVICPTVDVAARIQRYAPEINPLAVPHERALYRPDRSVTIPELQEGGKLRITSIGVMAPHKGGGFLLDCIELSIARGMDIEWTVIGEFAGQSLVMRASGLGRNLKVTGTYEADEVQELIAKSDPHLILFPQHCAETYSYTLSEAFESGRPVLAPNLGAFSERVEGVEAAWLYDYEAEAEEVMSFIQRLRSNALSSGKREPVEGVTPNVPEGIKINQAFYTDDYLAPVTTSKAPAKKTGAASRSGTTTSSSPSKVSKAAKPKAPDKSE